MRISLDVMPKDAPGELIKAIEPIGDAGGNIITIIHRRDEKSEKGSLPVHLVFDIDSKAQLENILERYKKENIKVIKVDEFRCFDEIVVGMIGHIMHTDLSETINSIESLGFCNVSDMQIEMPECGRESCAILQISIDTSKKDGCNLLMSKMKEIGEKKNIQVIESV